MLNVQLADGTPKEIKDAIAEWRRSHVSRFPVNVESLEERPTLVRFVDSRFPTEKYHRNTCLAVLSVEYDHRLNKKSYKFTSRLIQNEKYAAHNDDYRSKWTSDPKKLLKLFRDYAKPYTALEIMDRTSGGIGSDKEIWQSAPRDQFRSITNELRPDDIAEEIMYLQSVGVQFRSEKFRRVVSEGIDLYAEAQRRRQMPLLDVHVFIQPDESVQVSTASSGAKQVGSWVYPTLSEAPACVQGAVAMLRLCERNEYVPEMGRKVSDRLFWIHVNPNEFNPNNP